MPKRKQPECAVCGTEIDKHTEYFYNGYRYCEKCYIELLRLKQEEERNAKQ